jgi:hypothetical protein
VCSASGGFIAIRAANSKTMVTTQSNNAWILSVMSAKLFDTKPNTISTTNAENMEIREICKTLLLLVSINSPQIPLLKTIHIWKKFKGFMGKFGQNMLLL